MFDFAQSLKWFSRAIVGLGERPLRMWNPKELKVVVALHQLIQILNQGI